MWKRFSPSILLIIFIQFRFIESYMKVVQMNKLPNRETLVENQIHSYLDLLRNEELNNRIKRSSEKQDNTNRNARQNDNDLNNSNNNGEETFLESQMLQAPKLNTSSEPDSASSFETMASGGNSSYLQSPTGNPWKPDVSSYYPQQPSVNSYYPHQSTCICQPVYHRPPSPYPFYQPPELGTDAYSGYSYGLPAQGQHLPIFKPFSFSFEHGIYPGSSYFKPSRPDEYHGSYEAPKHSFIPIHRNFLKK